MEFSDDPILELDAKAVDAEWHPHDQSEPCGPKCNLSPESWAIYYRNGIAMRWPKREILWRPVKP